MTSEWAGFTEQEIRGLCASPVVYEEEYIPEVKPEAVVTKKKIRPHRRDRFLTAIPETAEDIPPGARLSQKEDEEVPVSLPSSNGPNIIPQSPPDVVVPTKEVISELSDVPNPKKIEEYEEKKRRIEEDNRRRKDLLERALADRAKKTQQEVKKLSQIEEELKKLDVTLSNDVATLRNLIDDISLDLAEAQKRFERAEKEYVNAKLNLFNVQEKKDLLTCHLCTIIEENELRKARKLSDLLQKLEVKPQPLTEEESAAPPQPPEVESPERTSQVRLSALLLM